MNIVKRIKRIWYRWRNSDPVHKCPVYLNKGCAHVDGMLCTYPDCDLIHKYLQHNWLSCGYCCFQDQCCSRNFGLGCYDGRIFPTDKEPQKLSYMKYKKKPEFVEMEQLSASNFDIICNFLGYTPEQIINPMYDFDGHGNSRDHIVGIMVKKDPLDDKSATVRCGLGDCIVRVDGMFEVMNPWDFRDTYEKVEE